MFDKCEQGNKKGRARWPKKMVPPVWVKISSKRNVRRRRSLFALERKKGRKEQTLEITDLFLNIVSQRWWSRSWIVYSPILAHREAQENFFGQISFFFYVCRVANVWLRNICRASRWWEVTTRRSLFHSPPISLALSYVQTKKAVVWHWYFLQ